MKLTPSMRRILMALDREGDMDAAEIAASAHVAESTLSGGGYLTKLLTMNLIRVSKWVRQERSGPATPIYSVSPGESKPKPKPYTVGQKCKRWRKKTGYRSAAWKAAQTMNELMRVTA